MQRKSQSARKRNRSDIYQADTSEGRRLGDTAEGAYNFSSFQGFFKENLGQRNLLNCQFHAFHNFSNCIFLFCPKFVDVLYFYVGVL